MVEKIRCIIICRYITDSNEIREKIKQYYKSTIVVKYYIAEYGVITV